MRLFSLAVVFASGLVRNPAERQPTREFTNTSWRIPNVLYDMSDKLQKQEAEQEQQNKRALIAKLGLKRFFDPAVAYVTGPANAKNTFVEFFDYNCIHCRNSVAAVKKFYEAHKNDTRFAFIEFPIFGEQSNDGGARGPRRTPAGRSVPHPALSPDGRKADDQTPTCCPRMSRRPASTSAKLDAPPAAMPRSTRRSPPRTNSARKRRSTARRPSSSTGQIHPGEITDAELKELTKS